MTSPTSSDGGQTAPAVPNSRSLSRMKLLFLLSAFIVPLLLAAIWLFVVKATGGEMGISARGQLIRPAVPLTPFVLQEQNAGTFDESALHGIWTLVYAPEGSCVEICQTNLYHMRQVWASLGHRMSRVQRAVILHTPDQLDPRLVQEHPGLRVLSGERESVLAQFAAAEQALPPIADAIYLIDPFGNLMMRFAHDLPPKSMLKDIKHLLKVSRIG